MNRLRIGFAITILLGAMYAAAGLFAAQDVVLVVPAPQHHRRVVVH